MGELNLQVEHEEGVVRLRVGRLRELVTPLEAEAIAALLEAAARAAREWQANHLTALRERMEAGDA